MTSTLPPRMNGSTRRAGRNATTTIAKAIRAAIYCRKSVDRGNGGDFGSIEAQRESCEAYIASQAGQGWVPVPTAYDDLGESGATIRRPQFQQLLADIRDGRVNAVVVYRLDRLCRNQRDLFNLLDYFETHGTIFVSISEHFDTATPTGRFTLGLLGQVAQLERETTAERVRDKMLASKRRGIWTGGALVLGYDTQDKKLVVNAEEAERVRDIFALYLSTPGFQGVIEELERRGWRNKQWTSIRGHPAGGNPIGKTSLSRLLTNALYVGKVNADGDLVDGEHAAIVDEGTFAAVQKKLASARRTTRPRTRSEALLAGLLTCARCGSPMSPHYASKGAQQWHYYCCTRAQRHGAKTCPGSRVRQDQMDTQVVDQIRAIGRDPAVIAATIRAAQDAHNARRPDLEADLHGVKTEAHGLDTERANIVTAVGRGDAPQSLIDRLRELDVEITGAEERRVAAHDALAALDDAAVDEGDLRIALAGFDAIWGVLFPQERQRIVHLLIDHIMFDSKTRELAISFRAAGVRMLRREVEDPDAPETPAGSAP